ncbi:acyl-CoA dehydrogenase family protein [Sphingobium sp.]|uniref:acyl-CoA dehydrogenase family protein n=1 Tax=Sphingobium sp. TaxID=1912891 RepID=UPI0028BEB158|nr:acyl-CoA dehydrogenase family protein [Sphingobium sp.]
MATAVIDRNDISYADRAREAGAKLLRDMEAALPVVRAHASEVEALGKVHPESLEALTKAGFFRAVVPLQYGGMECDPLSYMTACIRISQECPATGWVVGFYAVHAFQVALLDDRAQSEFWANGPDTRASSSYPPTGTVVSVEGGFRLSGEWQYSSGVEHAGWALLGGKIVDAPDGEDEYRTFLVPASDWVLKEGSWDVIGLKGTGSRTLVIDNAFVPEYRTHSSVDVYQGTERGFAVNDRPLYRLPFWSVFNLSVTATALGIARGGINAFIEAAKTRVSFAGKGAQVATSPFVQLRIFDAISNLDRAQDRMTANWRNMYETILQGHKLDRLSSIRGRVDGSDSIVVAFRSLTEIMEAAGGGVLFESNPLQRYFRDSLGVRVHPTAQREMFGTTYVQLLLGLEIPPFDKSNMFSMVLHT